jgi:hypothetical protein
MMVTVVLVSCVRVGCVIGQMSIALAIARQLTGMFLLGVIVCTGDDTAAQLRVSILYEVVVVIGAVMLVRVVLYCSKGMPEMTIDAEPVGEDVCVVLVS